VALRVLQPGLFTTIQDHGRPGYRGLGVPVSGAFDAFALDLANALLGNGPGCAGLEFTLLGGLYRAEKTLAIALAGAPMATTVWSSDGQTRVVPIPGSTTLDAGDQLQVAGSPHGARTYLAVSGGWRTPVILGSRSTETRLEAETVLKAEPGSTPSRRLLPRTPDHSPIRILDGPDAAEGADAGLLETQTFRVASESSRMGLRLTGEPISLRTPPDRPSSPVAPGAIQLAGDQCILLGVAGGTMGGYVHLGHVITADLDRLGQLRPGDEVRFQRVTLLEARELGRMERHERARRLRVVRAMIDQGHWNGT
jgi:biotin-dependent carboxylase-like uncharacterized protein